MVNGRIEVIYKELWKFKKYKNEILKKKDAKESSSSSSSIKCYGCSPDTSALSCYYI